MKKEKARNIICGNGRAQRGNSNLSFFSENKKGFTVVEVVVAFALMTVVLTSLVTFMVKLRDRASDESVKSQLLDYKNMITKVVYDDIITNKYEKIELCNNTDTSPILCVNFVDYNGVAHPFKIISNSSGEYIEYAGVKYLLPDSDIKNNKEGITMCSFINGINYLWYMGSSNNIYTIKLSYKHMGLDEKYDILITVN